MKLSMRTTPWDSLLAFSLTAVLVVLCGCLPAAAALGGDISSVEADQAHMKGTLHSTAAGAYTLHEIQAPSGTLREYASPAGKIFAVGWQGMRTPNLQQVLGPYFAQYQEAAAQERKEHPGRHPVVIETPGLVVEMGGHMRAFEGRAYVPEMLPQGVRAEDIR